MKLDIQNNTDVSEAGKTLAQLGRWELFRLDWNNLCLLRRKSGVARDLRKARFYLRWAVAERALCRAWSDEVGKNPSERRKRLKQAFNLRGACRKPQSEVEHEAEVIKRRAVSHPPQETERNEA